MTTFCCSKQVFHMEPCINILRIWCTVYIICISALLQFILKSYFPKIEEVVGLFKNLQETAKDHSHAVDPLSPTFPPPLLRAECQMVALFIHMCQMNPKMVMYLNCYELTCVVGIGNIYWCKTIKMAVLINLCKPACD